jgi:FG-GAP-like repeat
VDLDGDGRHDILSGSYSRKETALPGLFWVLQGKADGTFRPAEVLKGTDGEPLIIPLNYNKLNIYILTHPFAVDWDGDGPLDLVVSNSPALSTSSRGWEKAGSCRNRS